MVKTIKQTRSLDELIAEAREAAVNAIALAPDQRTLQVAEIAMEECDRITAAELGSHLLRGMFVRMIRAERSKEIRRQREQRMLPGYTHLPIRIRISDEKRKPLESATYSDVRAFVRRLSNLNRERARTDQKLIEARRLLELMSKYNRQTEGITVKEVVALEASR